MGLLPDEQTKNKAAQDIWKKKEVDRLLEMYLTGMDLGRIAFKLERNRKAIIRKIQEYIYNERDRVTNYTPRRRTSRAGQRMTPNELQMVEQLTKKRVPIEKIAVLLQRKVEELTGGKKLEEAPKISEMKAVAPTLHLIWAHRYIYFVWKKPLLSDESYNDLVKEEIEYGGGERAFEAIKAHQGWPDYIKSLALYLVDRPKRERLG